MKRKSELKGAVMTDAGDVDQKFLEVLVRILNLRGIEDPFQTVLLGTNGVADSVDIIEICVSLEDLAEDCGFKFDWSSERAMSRHSGIFRSVASLHEEFMRQYRENRR